VERGCLNGCWSDGRKLQEEDVISLIETDSRRATSDGEPPFDLVFDGCLFQGNQVDGVDGQSTFVANMGGHLEVVGCQFTDNNLTLSSDGRASMIWNNMGTTKLTDTEFKGNSLPDGSTTTIIANMYGDASVEGSCFRGSSVTAVIANFEITGASFMGERNYGDIEETSCAGVGTVKEGDPNFPETWEIECTPFDLDSCPLDIPTLSPTPQPTLFAWNADSAGALNSNGANSRGHSLATLVKLASALIIMVQTCWY